jgi:endonuclease V-like protein UPF0215 family
VLGIDDGPFEKRDVRPAPIVGVMMEGCDLVEAVAITEFPIDGEGATEFLGDWVAGLRLHPSLQALVLGGVTIAGLGIVDVEALSERLRTPVLVVNRRDPARARVGEALVAAGLSARLPILERTPPAFPIARGLWLACAGASPAEGEAIARACLRKSQVPEPLRLAHLVARALVRGESRGRP